FVLYYSAVHRVRPSFPTRRSSDLALIMAFLLTTTAPQQPAADHVAVFSNQQAQPQWLVSFDSASGKLTARALNVAATQVNAYELDRKSTRLNSSHVKISYAVFCLK